MTFDIKKIVVHFLVMTMGLHAQNPYFSQYYASPLYLNPALSGTNREISLGVNHRSQWNSNDSPYEISQFSFIYPLLSKGARQHHLGGVGFSVYQDVAGEGGLMNT